MSYPKIEEIVALLEFDLTDAELGMATATLEQVIVEACHLGRAWTEKDMPPIVAKCIRACMVRYLRRPEGYTTSRAGDETLIWTDDTAPGFPVFTKDEVEAIVDAAMGGRLPTLGSFGTTPQGYTRNRPGDDAVYVPVGDWRRGARERPAPDWFPYFVRGDFS